MKKAIKTDLHSENRPYEWAILANETLYAAAAPIRRNGEVEKGDISAQTSLTLENLRECMEAAGGSMADVTQVTLFITDRSSVEAINKIWRSAFPAPYPVRVTVVVNEIGAHGLGLVIQAQGHIPKDRQPA
ncbi:MAG: RidA family protein [Parvibaculaceae bacterium]